jgi:indole-3-glycerol phosphate synthase
VRGRRSNAHRRNPKAEGRRPKVELESCEQRTEVMANATGVVLVVQALPGFFGIRISAFFRPSDFGLRPSYLVPPMTILETIVEQKRLEVARLPKQAVSVSSLRSAMNARGGRRDFLAALRAPKIGSVALIAEVKKASPSAGVICPNFDPVRIAREYEAAGASCLSVLTDEKFFQGSLEVLRAIRQSVNLPLLRKDFIIDARQILEAIQWGADAILLIVSILTDKDLPRFHELASEAGLAVLVEAHDEEELVRAVAAGARLVGINNRDLKTFKVDLGTTERLAGRLRGRYGQVSAPLLVAESGIHGRADVERLSRCGVGAILVGESLMRESNIGAKIRELLGAK